MKHKHCELIKAWADGAEIQSKNRLGNHDYEPDWLDDPNPNWGSHILAFRIKPEPKPDYYTKHIAYKARIYSEGDRHQPTMPNLKLCFDGETGELKSAEVLK